VIVILGVLRKLSVAEVRSAGVTAAPARVVRLGTLGAVDEHRKPEPLYSGDIATSRHSGTPIAAPAPLHTLRSTHIQQSRYPQWSTRSSSGAGSVRLSLPGYARYSTDDMHQALPRDYGNSALRCAPFSARNPSGFTPFSPALAAASATGSQAWSSDSSGSLPTNETNYSRSAHGGRSVMRWPHPRKGTETNRGPGA
jgi:hypothetical protein